MADRQEARHSSPKDSKERFIRATISEHRLGTQIEIDTIGDITMVDAKKVAISIILSCINGTKEKHLMNFMQELTAEVILTEASNREIRELQP